MSEFVTVAKVGEIPEGEGKAFQIDEMIVAVFNDKGVYRAMDDMCPHMGASLATGFFEDSIVACPWHAWRFDTRDGAWCDNRRLKIDVFDVRVEGDEIQVCKTPRDAEPDTDEMPKSNKTSNASCDSPCDASDSSGEATGSPRENGEDENADD